MKIVCPDGTPTMRQPLGTELEAKLESLGSFTWFDGHPETLEAYLERVRDADGILLNWDIPPEVLNSCSKLRIISFFGTDPRKFVDLPLATSKGIAVTNTPHYGNHAVAEHTLALILCCAKRITHFSGNLHQGLWEGGSFTFELWGKTLGLVGLGGIGTEVARLTQAFGMRVLYYDVRRREDIESLLGVEYVSKLRKIFEQSDVVTLHVAHTPETERIITRGLLELLKPGAILVNTARAELVDNRALADLLRKKKLGAVGLDVYDEEPVRHDNPFLGIENAVLTPHVAFYTAEANYNILKISIDNLVAFFSGHPQNVVNSEVLGRYKNLEEEV